MKPSYARIPSKINALRDRAKTSQICEGDTQRTLSAVHQITDSLDYERLMTGWACRKVEIAEYEVWSNAAFQPEAGDVAVFRVDRVGHHDHLASKDDLRLQISKDDFFTGVFGNRYATDTYEGIVAGTEVLHLLSSAGMVGTLLSKNESIQYPTSVSLVGYLTTKQGSKVNLRDLHVLDTKPGLWAAHLILFLGTGIKSGKTTAATNFVKGLVSQGLRVSMCKLTGSASCKDRSKIAATRAHDVRDFSDYGFPSTYLCSKSELRNLFDAMLADALKAKPHFVVMEVAGGLLQRETRLILEDKNIQKRADSVVLSASCSLSALEGVRRLRWLGHKVAAVSGKITNSPLYVREFHAQSRIPIGYLHTPGNEFTNLVQNQLIPSPN